MKIPSRLIPLVEDGIIDEVLGQVKSGKEADVFIVRIGEEVRCAKVYKEANNRSFRQAVQYQEGRKVQNSRSARAMSKRTSYGQKEAESSWINAEVEALNVLSAAGIRVPKPFGFFDGVLIMELIVDEDGQPAPRLNDIALSAETALLYHEELIAQIVRMLCSGIIHGDLSEFNVLVDAEGPVIIDLPQAVNAAGNNSAGMMFARDVDNMARYFGRFEPGILGLKYAKEIWALYEKGKLTPHAELTGQFQEPTRSADVNGVLSAIGDARLEHEERLQKKAQAREPYRKGEAPDDRTPQEEKPAYPPRNNPGHRHSGGHGGSGRQSGNQGGQGRQPGNPAGPSRPNGNQSDQRGQGNQGNQRGQGGQSGQSGQQRQPGNQGGQGQRQHGGPGSQGPRQGNHNPRHPGGQSPQSPRHSSGQGTQGPRQSQGQSDQAPKTNPPSDQNSRSDSWGRRSGGGNKRNRPG
jgi:RIO kinase 1